MNADICSQMPYIIIISAMPNCVCRFWFWGQNCWFEPKIYQLTQFAIQTYFIDISTIKSSQMDQFYQLRINIYLPEFGEFWLFFHCIKLKRSTDRIHRPNQWMFPWKFYIGTKWCNKTVCNRFEIFQNIWDLLVKHFMNIENNIEFAEKWQFYLRWMRNLTRLWKNYISEFLVWNSNIESLVVWICAYIL